MTSRWKKRPLGDLLQLQNGFAFDSKKFGTTGTPLIRIRDLKGGAETDTCFDGQYDKRYLVEKGDLLIGMDGEFRCYEWKGQQALLNQRVCRLQGFSGDLSPRFVLYGINKYLKEIEDVTAFATVKHLSSKQILGIDFPAPPIEEQNRIVAVLDDAFAGIAIAKANTERSLQGAAETLEAYLETIFASRKVAWTDRKLSSLCKEVTVGYVGPMKHEYVSTGIPFLRSQNIRPFEIALDNLVFIRESFHRSIAKSRLRPGDLAIVRTGYPGTAAVIPPELLDANCSDLVIMRLGPDVNPHFLAAFFNSAFGKRTVIGKLVGAAQKHFNVGAAKDVVLHLPSLPEQDQIVRRIAELRLEVGGLQSIYSRKLAALDALKQSVLQKAFSGEL